MQSLAKVVGDKKHQRQLFKKQRLEYEESYGRKALQQQVLKQLKSVLRPEWTVAGFMPMTGEAGVDWLFESMPEINWVFPVCKGSKLEFYKAQKREDFQLNSLQVLEPSQSFELVPLENIDAVLVPGVVFNHFGQRVGMGKGFYDKSLEKFYGVKIGVGYHCQLQLDELPTEPHDLIMDFIVTDKVGMQVHLQSFYDDERGITWKH